MVKNLSLFSITILFMPLARVSIYWTKVMLRSIFSMLLRLVDRVLY